MKSWTMEPTERQCGQGMPLHSVDCPEKLCPDCAQGLYGRIVPKDCAQAGWTINAVSSSARVSEQALEKLY